LYQEAISEFHAALLGIATQPLAGIGRAYALSGRRSEALKVLKQLQETSTRSFVSPFDFATAYVGLGEKEQATEWLERAIECIAFRSFTSRLSPGSIPCAPIRVISLCYTEFILRLRITIMGFRHHASLIKETQQINPLRRYLCRTF